MADAEPPTAEEPVGEQPPAQPQAEQAPLEAAAETALRLPAAQAPAASVWEEAASPPEPGAAAESEPRGDAGEAFEAWFDAGEPAAHDAAPPPRSVSAEEEDDDDDLEMFRSWLQSLKK